MKKFTFLFLFAMASQLFAQQASRGTEAITHLKLKLSSATQDYNTDIYFTGDATLGLDPGYDAAVFGNSTSGFSLYSNLVAENEGLPFAIQSVGETDYNDITIPLGVHSEAAVQITFNIVQSSIPESVAVFLDDTVANISTLLTETDYVLTPDTALNGVGRFYLRFVGSNLGTHNQDFQQLGIIMSNQTKELIVKGRLLEATVCTIYDIGGRLVSNHPLEIDQTENRIALSYLTSGIYIIRIKDQKQENAFKVIID